MFGDENKFKDIVNQLVIYPHEQTAGPSTSYILKDVPLFFGFVDL